ncbi:MAG: hypothetical protein ACNS61_03355, partial [Candidatus Wenzhouxiangella sp. M2_3B_020]
LDRLAADYEARKQRLHARWTCAVRPTEAVLKHDEDGAVAEHMALIVEHGELEGRIRFAESRGIDCSDPSTWRPVE